MTSALGVGRGAPKSRQKEQNQLISERDKGVEGVKNFADVLYGSPYFRGKTLLRVSAQHNYLGGPFVTFP